MDRLAQICRHIGQNGERRIHDQVGFEDDPVIAVFGHALAVHAHQHGFLLVIPPVGSDIDRALTKRDHRIFMAAGIDQLSEEGVGIDAHLVERETRHIVARCRIGIDQTDVLALQIFDLLVGRIFLHIEYRIIALGAVQIDLHGNRLDLGAVHIGAGIGGWSVESQMDLAGLLAFDHGGIILCNAQGHFGAELFGEIGNEGAITLVHARSIFIGDGGKNDFRIFGFPVLCEGTRNTGSQRASRKARHHDTTIDHVITSLKQEYASKNASRCMLRQRWKQQSLRWNRFGQHRP